MGTFAMERKCVLCEGSMEEGFVIDYTYGSRVQQEWGAGRPERSFWSGLKKITTFCCTKCGYLMEFASPVEVD